MRGLLVGNRYTLPSGKQYVVTGFDRDHRGPLVVFEERWPGGLRIAGGKTTWAAFERRVAKAAKTD